jgi:hypothetical protein
MLKGYGTEVLPQLGQLGITPATLGLMLKIIQSIKKNTPKPRCLIFAVSGCPILPVLNMAGVE